ncbi:hypothetical protein FOXB_02352 [Fusarium oxysporum f. sp. conglutinans Fo5176]|uniref:Uncharacterized protein n=1 Tax=Fusarium oxysporum (strain Fo5176) TaxID=660025 RepID=F9F7H7_FUSOF|nr:hypothetical protein FOXB_02352 [Fusarium oxysporum f. sp. conglutinans Fo5176]
MFDKVKLKTLKLNALFIITLLRLNKGYLKLSRITRLRNY